MALMCVKYQPFVLNDTKKGEFNNVSVSQEQENIQYMRYVYGTLSYNG